ncbi:hypothetical protein HZH66_006799 [Vespula vulgaris]|uniref:Uncharacterized protein n=1 Tax=Vespula vulgaris TaxID=7454 RepID=A0A834K2J3_VESVU|nr:hypothetical protein HZH66_006799 [Vespula vulgaris]
MLRRTANSTGAESKPRPVVAWQHHLSRIIYYRATTASSKSGQERDYRNCRQETSILPTNLDVLDFGLDCESSRSIRISFLDSLWDHTGWKITHASIDRFIKQYGVCSTSQTLPILICGSGVDTAEEEGSGEEEVPDIMTVRVLLGLEFFNLVISSSLVLNIKDKK